ncbi:MAG: mechanosensitive ion channel family protein [Candidatus Poseidoniaceae archaeon]|nr:mechanosensitive ion channel family protein [Candidatus Poseidoniaceae archaeon]
MEALIQMIPGWDSKVVGLQLGLLVAIAVIVAIGLVARQIVIIILPKIMKSFGDEKEGISSFEMNSQMPLGAAAAGFIWWNLFAELYALPSMQPGDSVEFWTLAFAQAAYLIGGLVGAMRLVEIVEIGARWADDDGESDAGQQTILHAVQSILRVVIFIVGVVLIADVFGFNIGAILTGLGIGGLAFAFAAKDTISNVFGAITLLLDRPFSIGDWIKVGAAEGEVIGIGMRTTLLRSSADTVLTLPNGNLVNKDIENFGKRRWRRYQPVLSLDLATDSKVLEKFCRGVEEIIFNHKKTTKEESSYAKVSSIAKDSLEVSCNVYWDVSGGMEEKESRESLLLDISSLAKELKVDFYEPRLRASRS